ncbi:MAG: SIMPL domain-containing protein [Pseudonocardiaceae bacterium]
MDGTQTQFNQTRAWIHRYVVWPAGPQDPRKYQSMEKEAEEMSVEEIQRTISVTGVGRVAAAADLLVLNLAVETQAVTALDALTENNKQAAAVQSALREHGIQERDIQTTQLSIDPVMERQDQNDTRPPKTTAYRVRNGLSAKLRDIQGAGTVIDAAVQAGGDATRIEGISFSFADPSRLLGEARKRAIDDAGDRARQLTDGLGVGLGDVISISESDLSGGSTIRQFAAFADSTPVFPGESETSLQVTVGYEISTK